MAKANVYSSFPTHLRARRGHDCDADALVRLARGAVRVHVQLDEGDNKRGDEQGHAHVLAAHVAVEPPVDIVGAAGIAEHPPVVARRERRTVGSGTVRQVRREETDCVM